MNASLPFKERLVGIVKCIPFIGQVATFTSVLGHSVRFLKDILLHLKQESKTAMCS